MGKAFTLVKAFTSPEIYGMTLRSRLNGIGKIESSTTISGLVSSNWGGETFAGAGRGGVRKRSAFTLIELLVVIAIISILIALIFPVVGSILENGRETNSMSNMQQISSALALYKLDNRTYPPVLFGYADTADTGISMGSAQADPNASTYLVGLYPQYVKDWHVFLCQNNPTDDYTKTVAVNVNTFPSTPPGGDDQRDLAVQSPEMSFFTADAYDISPQITGINQTSKTVYVPRYQVSWLSYPSTAQTPCYPAGCASATDVDYARQLRWELPPSDTYVTSTTYHVGNANRVLVLNVSGQVRKTNVDQGSWSQTFPAAVPTAHSSYCDDSPDISAPLQSSLSGGTRPDAAADFWRYCGTSACSGG